MLTRGSCRSHSTQHKPKYRPERPLQGAATSTVAPPHIKGKAMVLPRLSVCDRRTPAFDQEGRYGAAGTTYGFLIGLSHSLRADSDVGYRQTTVAMPRRQERIAEIHSRRRKTKESRDLRNDTSTYSWLL